MSYQEDINEHLICSEDQDDEQDHFGDGDSGEDIIESKDNLNDHLKDEINQKIDKLHLNKD